MGDQALMSMNRKYIAEYISTAIQADAAIAAPTNEAGQFSEQLNAIYYAHRAGGSAGAYKVWTDFRRTYPELEQLVKQAESLIHADDLRNLKIPTYLLPDYPLYSGAMNLIVGASGHGKSFVALDIASRLALHANVVYIAGEGLSGYAARWEAWKDYHQVKRANLYFYAEALQVMEQYQMEAFLDLLRSHKPALVIVDTLARSAVGLDENSAKDMGQFVAACDYLRIALETSVLIVHHSGKSGDIRGSTALYGAADAVITVAKIEGLVRVSNQSAHGGKNKYGEDTFEAWYKITPHSVDGLEGAVICPAEKLEDIASKVSDLQLKILAVLKDFADGAQVKDITPSFKSARSTVYSNLNKLVAAGFAKKEYERYLIAETGLEVLEIFGGDYDESE